MCIFVLFRVFPLNFSGQSFIQISQNLAQTFCITTLTRTTRLHNQTTCFIWNGKEEKNILTNIILQKYGLTNYK